MIALPTLDPTLHTGDICTCLMLLHLERMRDPSRAPSSLFSNPATLIVPTPHHPSILAPVIREGVRTGIPSWIGGNPRALWSLLTPPRRPLETSASYRCSAARGRSCSRGWVSGGT
ncbi:hypothetical protein D9619_012559 [Psilocybe cf. subviscida]|uniref:Uncharacterized protein n=1 Tax=Psilocybe cf. subviscida TaxID=2480587 RepID=A0A8H5B6G0_9AGAR|nr:hypothetical protein D9619_012559 [Psilocybe cf. subviscida]